MAISFPHDPPASPVASRVDVQPRIVSGMTESPFTLEAEVFEYQGQMLTMAVELPPMRRDQAEQWIAWSLALNGRVGTFRYGVPSINSVRGSGAGVPVIDGSGQQRAKTIATRGWVASDTVLNAGDLIEIGTVAKPHLYRVLQDVTADGSGTANIDIWPAMRDALVDGQTIRLSNTRGIWRLAQPVDWSISAAQIYGLSFNAMEAL